MENPLFESIHRIVAVVGCQRSGTTLTGQILGTAPRTVVVDEHDGADKWFRAQADGRSEAAAFLESMINHAAVKYRRRAERFCRNSSSKKFELRDGPNTLVVKAPNLTYDYDMLRKFPLPVTVVYPVRDPRSVVVSMMRLDEKDFAATELRQSGRLASIASAFRSEREILAADDQPVWIRYATVWKIKSGLAPRFREADLPLFQFRYEDMIRRRELVNDMFAHCGLEVTKEAMNPETVYRGRGPGEMDRTRSIDETSLESWKDCLDEAKEADVLRASNPLARDLGYT